MIKPYRFGIVISRFNEGVTSRLLDGAKMALKDQQISDVPVFWVPGAYEIPLVCKKMALTSRYNAIITLGAVIRGETGHYEYVCGPVAHGISQVAVETGVPILFGVLTTDDEEQALARSKPDQTNKGYEAVLGAIEMVELLRSL